MRKGTPLLILLLAIPSAAAMDLQFTDPASVGGDVSVQRVAWLAARFDEGQAVSVDLVDAGTLVVTNYTYPLRVDTPVSFFEGPPTSDSKTQPASAGRYELVAGPGGATVAIRLQDAVSFKGDASVLRLDRAGVSGLVQDGGRTHGWSTWSQFSTEGVALVATVEDLSLAAVQAKAIEWFNMDVTCAAARCPSGGGRSDQKTEALGTSVLQTTYSFDRLQGDLRISSSWAGQAVLGAPSLDIHAVGRVHLPVAAGTTCTDCPALEDQTLALQGVIDLQGLRPESDGFRADVSGQFDSARIDEAWVSPATLGSIGTAAAAVIGIGLLLKAVLVPLFTRLSKEQALEHPKRQKIYQYIQQHPGANFREVARETAIAAGTVRHHLTVLERAGHIVEHQHNGTVRLFENHGKFDHNWSDMVLLREPALSQLHGWLKANPGSPQKDVLEAMESLGWSRSTTQHRLVRLVEGGLVTIRLQGRLKMYGVVDRAKTPLVSLEKPSLGIQLGVGSG